MAVKLALWWARRRYPIAWRKWPEDTEQAVHLALAEVGSTASPQEIFRAVSRSIYRLTRELGDAPHQYTKYRVLMSARRSRIAKALRMRDEGFTAREINDALGAAAAQCAAKHASEATFRGDRGNEARWGNYAIRRAAARELRRQGRTLKQIAEALGLSVAGVHYAVKNSEK